MTVTVDIRRVIDALYAIDGIRGVLADRKLILGEELEKALRRLVPQAAATMAAEFITIPRCSSRIMQSATVSLAPEEMPSTNGPAMGFAKKV